MIIGAAIAAAPADTADFKNRRRVVVVCPWLTLPAARFGRRDFIVHLILD
jgi:hypothetical protein